MRWKLLFVLKRHPYKKYIVFARNYKEGIVPYLLRIYNVAFPNQARGKRMLN